MNQIEGEEITRKKRTNKIKIHGHVVKGKLIEGKIENIKAMLLNERRIPNSDIHKIVCFIDSEIFIMVYGR